MEHITLHQFEQIDGLRSSILRMGDIEALIATGNGMAVRDYIRATNRLLDACIDAIGYEAASEFPSAEACAADIVTRSLMSASFVVDMAA